MCVFVRPANKKSTGGGELLPLCASRLLRALCRFVARRNAYDSRACRNVFRNDGPGAGGGALSNAHGRDQHRIAADEGVLADEGLVLGVAVEVAGNRARADIHILAQRGVAHVAEVPHLRAAS